MTETDILNACASNDVACVTRLLKNNANVNTYSLFSYDVAGRLLWPSQVATFPLEIAAQHNYVTLAQTLLKHNDIDTEQTDYNGETALFTACKRNHPEVAALLLQHTPSLVNSTTYACSTPLLVSLQFNSWECTKLLLKQPLLNVNFPRIRVQWRQVNSFDYANAISPLEYCVHMRNERALHMLLARPDTMVDWALIAATCTYGFANAACIMLVKKHRLLSPIKLWCMKLMRKTMPDNINELVHVFTTPQTRMKTPLKCSRLFSALNNNLLSSRDVHVLLKSNVLQITNFKLTEYASFARLARKRDNSKAAYAKSVTNGWAPCRHKLYPHARFRCVVLLFMLLHHRLDTTTYNTGGLPCMCQDLWLHIIRFVSPHDCAALPLNAAGKRQSVQDLQ